MCAASSAVEIMDANMDSALGLCLVCICGDVGKYVRFWFYSSLCQAKTCHYSWDTNCFCVAPCVVGCLCGSWACPCPYGLCDIS